MGVIENDRIYGYLQDLWVSISVSSRIYGYVFRTIMPDLWPSCFIKNGTPQFFEVISPRRKQFYKDTLYSVLFP